MRKQAKRFGHRTESIDDLLQFLLRVDADLLTSVSVTNVYQRGGPRKEINMIWTPIPEVAEALHPFMTKPAHQQIHDINIKQSIDTMFGYTSAEMYFLTMPELRKPELLTRFNEKFELELPRNELKTDYQSEDYQGMAKEIRDFYFSKTDGQVNIDSVLEFNDLLSDVWFTYAIEKAAKIQLKRSTGKIFYYLFSLDTNLNGCKLALTKNAKFPGASHADDLYYVFCRTEEEYIRNLYKNLAHDSVELKSVRLVARLWTSFAKYGNPMPNDNPVHVKPVSNDELNYFEITNDGLAVGQNPFEKRMKFWNDFYGKYEKILERMTVAAAIQ